MQTFEASDGLRLAYVVDDFTDPWTTPETVVLLHAGMGSSRRFYAWVPILGRLYRLVRPDLRGHGASGIRDPDELTLDRLARDVIDLADHLGVERFHLAGVSGGAIVSLAVAIRHPERVRTLAVFATTPGLRRSNIDAERWGAEIRAKGVRRFLRDRIADRFDLATVEPDRVEWFVEESAKTPPEVLARFVSVMTAVDLTGDLARIECPTLAVAPEHDPLSPMAEYEVFRDRVRDCEFLVYHGLPHNIADAAPDRCAEDLRTFLMKHRGRS